MLKVLKKILVISLALVFTILISPKKISATDIVTSCSQLPSPQIVHPTNNSQIIRDGTAGGSVAVSIYIDPVAITSIDVYVATSSGQTSFVGTATKGSGSPYFNAVWQTGGYVDGIYTLTAKAQIYCSPDIVIRSSTPIQVTLSTLNAPSTEETSTTPSSTTSPTPNPPSDTQASSSEPITTVINPKGETTQQKVDANTIKIAAIDPKTLIPFAKPSSIVLADNVAGSEIISAITFTADLNKNTRLEKIENRRSKNQQKFLLFSGHANANSRVTISIYSEDPIIINTTSDSNGNWTYTFEKPLEPGKHKVVIEVGQDEAKETAGPYFFSIARAQASADNPTGASLDLVDPAKSIKNYLLIAGALVLLSIAIIIVIRLRKKEIFNPQAPAPTKAI